MSELNIFAAGDPRPQGSKTPGMTAGGKLFVRESGGDKHKRWRQTVRDAAAQAANTARWPTQQGAVMVRLDFIFQARKGVADAEGAPKISSPDLDKLARSVLDSLTDAAIWADDARVVDLVASKRYTVDPARVGVHIQVATLTE